MNKGMKPRMGRHPIPLPGGMSPEAHEARRKSLGLSCRKYAKSIGIPVNTYIKKSKVADPYRRSRHHRQAPVDIIKAAEEFMLLWPKYVQELRNELAATEKIRADAASKAQEIRRVLGVLSNGVRETPDEHAAAVSMGRRGGKKGGVARASSLSPERRTELASKAAMARWHPELNGVVRDVRQSST
jgi:hypothetical protein